MPLLGQASGGWTESSSALRLLHAGKRNTVGVLTDDAFTQANPPVTAANATAQVDTTATGVLSGSIAYARQDAGENFIGGPTAGTTGGVADARQKALGVFINSANGNAFENTPGTASGKGPYMSGQGTYGNSLFETLNINSGAALTYVAGDLLVGSFNGYLTNVTAANNSHDRDHVVLDAMGAAYAETIGILKMAPDATQNELVYDQRI
jgi:hypothetical protein